MPRPSKYDAATRERAVRMYYERLDEGGISKTGAREEIGELLDVKESTLRNWIRSHDKQEDAAADAKMSYAELKKAYEAERQRNRRLEKANKILKTASAFSPRRSSTANSGSRGFHPYLPAPLRGRVDLCRAHRTRHHDCPEHFLRPSGPRLRSHRRRTAGGIHRASSVLPVAGQ